MPSSPNFREEVTVCSLRSQVIFFKQPNLGLTQESLRMVTARVLVVISGSFTSQINVILRFTRDTQSPRAKVESQIFISQLPVPGIEPVPPARQADVVTTTSPALSSCKVGGP